MFVYSSIFVFFVFDLDNPSGISSYNLIMHVDFTFRTFYLFISNVLCSRAGIYIYKYQNMTFELFLKKILLFC